MGKKKVKLPTDRNGRVIDIGDWLIAGEVISYGGES